MLAAADAAAGDGVAFVNAAAIADDDAEVVAVVTADASNPLLPVTMMRVTSWLAEVWCLVSLSSSVRIPSPGL